MNRQKRANSREQAMFEPLHSEEDDVSGATMNPLTTGPGTAKVSAMELEVDVGHATERSSASRSGPRRSVRGRARAEGVGSAGAAVSRWVRSLGVPPAALWITFAFFVLMVTAVALLGSITGQLKRDLPAPRPTPSFNPVSGWSELAAPAPSPSLPSSSSVPFLTLFSSANDTSALRALIPRSMAPDGTSGGAEFLISAIYDRGSFVMEAGTQGGSSGGVHASLLHMPAESTVFNVFSFAQAPGSDGLAVDLRRSQYQLRAAGGAGSSMDLAATEGAWGGWLATLPVLAVRQAGGTWTRASAAAAAADGSSLLVSLSPLLKAGFFVTLPPSKLAVRSARIASASVYASNAVVRAQYEVKKAAGSTELSGATFSLSLAFSITLLPETPMASRVADDRVGYFTSHYVALGVREGAAAAAETTRASSLVDPSVTLINRRRLDAVQKTITYYIDPTVPSRWRPYMQQGVEEWNKAFALIGKATPETPAIRAVLPTDPDWPADYNAADTRYSSISWAVDIDQTYALGPSTVDPRSGEIIDANIVFTNGWIRSWLRSFERLDVHPKPPPTLASEHDNDHGSKRSLRGSRSTGFELHSSPCKHGAAAPISGAASSALHVDHRGGARCHQHRSFAHGGCQHSRSQHQTAAAPLLLLQARITARRSAVQAGNGGDIGVEMNAEGSAARRTSATDDEPIGDVDEKIIGAGLKDVTMHEVGHTLGLRHNFIASANRTVAQLTSESFVQEWGLADSVMDYLPVAVLSSASAPSGTPFYFTPTLGVYDKFAIEWGYREDPAAPDAATAIVPTESDTQKQLAERGFPFASDYDVADESPLVNRFDLGDPLEYYVDRLQLVREMQKDLADDDYTSAVRLGESWVNLLPAILTLLRTVQNAGVFIAKYVGGVKLSRAWRTQQSPSPMPVQFVDSTLQRSALGNITWIVTESVNPGTPGLFPSATVFQKLLKRNGECDGVETFCMGLQSVDIVDYVRKTQIAVLDALVSIERLQRLLTNSIIDTSALTVDEVLSKLTDSLFGPGASGGSVASSSFSEPSRWRMQTYWLEKLVEVASIGHSATAAADATESAAIAAFATKQLVVLIDGITEALKTANKTDPAFAQLNAALLVLQRWRQNNIV